MPVSTVPAAISALLTLAQAAITNADVFAGPPNTANYQDWVGIAYDPTGGEIVRTDTAWAALGAQRYEESYEITCTIGAESGDLDPVGQRARAYELLDSLGAALTADYALGGAVRTAHISGHSLISEVDDNGWSEVLRFTVSVQARI